MVRDEQGYFYVLLGMCKHNPKKVPVVERPIFSKPFEDVAVGIVGPLPKGRGEVRYLLTFVCLATKWPDTIPLSNITARSIAEGLWSIFSRTSFPERILTDQGTQFCSWLMKELCALL